MKPRCVVQGHPTSLYRSLLLANPRWQAGALSLVPALPGYLGRPRKSALSPGMESPGFQAPSARETSSSCLLLTGL